MTERAARLGGLSALRSVVGPLVGFFSVAVVAVLTFGHVGV